MKNIPDIHSYFLIFTHNRSTDKIGYWILCDKYNYDYYDYYRYSKVIIILDSKNVNVKFVFDKNDCTVDNGLKLKNKDSIFKLTDKDLK